MASRVLLVAAMALAADAVQVMLYKFANCTGDTKGTFHFLRDTCTPVSAGADGDYYSIGLTSCDSDAKMTVAMFSKPGCGLPTADILYDVPLTAGACISPPGQLASLTQAKGMKLINTACTGVSLLYGAMHTNSDTSCASTPSYAGLFATPATGGSACWTTPGSGSLALQFNGYDPAVNPPQFNDPTGQTSAVMLWQNGAQATCNVTADSAYAETTRTLPVPRDGCAALSQAGSRVFNTRWTNPAGYNPSGPNAVPSSIPKGSISPLRCYTGNNSRGTPVLGTDADSDICATADFTCTLRMPDDVRSSLGCSDADFAAEKVVKTYTGFRGNSWNYINNLTLINCTVPAAQGGCPAFRNIKTCNTEGCNVPPKTNGAQAAGSGVAAATAVLVALLTVIGQRGREE